MKNFLAIPLLAILIISCNNEEKIENEKIEQNQELLKGVWETGKKIEIEKTENGSKQFTRYIKEFNFTSKNDLICTYCGIGYNYNWSCTSEKVTVIGLSDEIEEYKIISLDSKQLILEGFKTYINEDSESETHTVRIELQRRED